MRKDRKIGRDQWLPPPEPDDQRDGGQGFAAGGTSVPEMTGAPREPGATVPGWAAGVHGRAGIMA